MYDQAAQAQFLNTYAPINFGELYRIGAAQKQAVDEAAQQFSNQLQKFGEFQSPSQVDTQKYYDLTIGKEDFQNAINQMISNPDYLKDAANRSLLQSMINSVDYSTLSKLKQSSDNLKARQKIIAQLKAQGKYNPNWDNININLWDTSKQGVMTELSPLEWMNANQLSNVYFDNLKPSALPSIYRNGVKYQRQGITYDTLKGIAEARFNDLIATPQGQMYYRDALRASGGDEQAAKEAFTTMIADSQRDRIIEQETIDPYWLAMAKKSFSGSGNVDVVKSNPTRLDFLNDTMYKTASKNLGGRFDNYKQYLSSLITKYPNSKIAKDAKKGLQNIDDKQNAMMNYAKAAQTFSLRYSQTNDPADLEKAITASKIAENYQNSMLQIANKHILRDEFQKVANFSPISVKGNPNFSHEGYMRGVNASLDLIKGKVGVTEDDALLTAIGGRKSNIVNENGTTDQVFTFSSSEGFLFPETIFNITADVNPRDIKRAAGTFRSGDFPLKELVESGRINDVQFKSDNGIVKIGDNFALSGKIRIPKDEITRYISTGLYSPSFQPEQTNFPTTVQSIRTAIENIFGGRKVTEIVNEDDRDFYEIDSYKILPKEDVSSEYWQRVNQEWQGGKSGIGGSSQAKENYMYSAEQTLR